MTSPQDQYPYQAPELRPVDQVEDLYDLVYGELLVRYGSGVTVIHRATDHAILGTICAVLAWTLQLKGSADALREVLALYEIPVDADCNPILNPNEENS